MKNAPQGRASRAARADRGTTAAPPARPAAPAPRPATPPARPARQGSPAADPRAPKAGARSPIADSRSPVRVAPAGPRPRAARRRTQARFPIPIWMLGVGATVLVIGVVLVLAAQAAPKQVTNTVPVPAGQAAPGFSLPATDGQTYTLAQFSGKPLMLEFMAPWCSHCQEMAPIFHQVYTTYQGQGLNLLGISATPYGRNFEAGDNSAITMDDLKWFSSTYSVPYPLLFNPDLQVANAYAVTQYPTVYTVSKSGTISQRFVCPCTYDQLSAAAATVVK